MAQNRSYITLDSVITDFMIEAEQNQSKYFKNFHLAFRGMENLGLDFFYQIKSVKLPINDNLTVTIPADFLNWTKCGVLNERGEIIPLYYNDKLTTFSDLNPDRVERTQDDTLIDWENWGTGTWFNYWTGYGYTNIYGVPSGAPDLGSFKVDNANGVILLNHSFGYDYFMLEYLASPVEGNDYYLPVQFREALIAWLWWKNSSSIPVRSHVSLGDRRDKRHEFYVERTKAIAAWKPIRTQEIYEASQQMTRLAIKT